MSDVAPHVSSEGLEMELLLLEARAKAEPHNKDRIAGRIKDVKAALGRSTDVEHAVSEKVEVERAVQRRGRGR